MDASGSLFDDEEGFFISPIKPRQFQSAMNSLEGSIDMDMSIEMSGSTPGKLNSYSRG